MAHFQSHHEAFANRRLERRIVTFLVNHGRPDLCALQIRARGGVVRLRGHVASIADRDYVLQGVRRVAGVLAVEDNITVDQPSKQSPAGAAPMSPHLPPAHSALLLSA
jgi:osmotically-inducible protein OsmY